MEIIAEKEIRIGDTGIGVKQTKDTSIVFEFFPIHNTPGKTSVEVYNAGKEEMRALGHMLIDLASEC